MIKAHISLVRKNQKGQAALMLTFGIVSLLGLLGLVVDVGYGYYVKQVAQAAADSAVMAAITMAKASGGTCSTGVLCQTGYSCPVSPTSTTDFGVACMYAKANGFTNTGKQAVSISSGTGVPPSNPGITTSYWITVTATQQQGLGFLRILGATGAQISAQATGAVIIGQNSGGCVYVLSPNQGAAMTIKGTSTVWSDCGIYVNSSASNAFSVTGNSTTTSSVINVVGGSSINNNATVSPTPQNGATAAADPLASLPAPSYSGCDYNAYSSSGGTITLNPGVYCGGISITGQANLTLNPGTYILNGGGFTSTSNNTVMNGQGVFFYNTSNGYTFGPISLAGGTQITLTAPTAGTYKGILFYQDRNINSSATNTIAGGANPTMTGSVYMPTADVSFVGNSATSQTLAFIVRTLTVTGTSYLKKDPTGDLTGMVQSTAALVQ